MQPFSFVAYWSLLAAATPFFLGSIDADIHDRHTVVSAASSEPARANQFPNSSDSFFLLELSTSQLKQMHMGTSTLVQFNVSAKEPFEVDHVSLHVVVSNTAVATPGSSDIVLDWFEESRSFGKLMHFGRRIVAVGQENLTDSSSGSFSIEALSLGHARATLTMKYYNVSTDSFESALIATIPISVRRTPMLKDLIFQIFVFILMIATGVVTSLKLELQVIKEALRKPKAPIIGFFSQYVTMPLISYAIIVVLGFSGGTALGLFALGCGPGGGLSNLFALLLDGDVSVSMAMTLISTFASLGMMPLWMYTLGATLPESDTIAKESIKIPFVNILTTVATIVAPGAVGLFINWKLPRFSRAVIKWVNPMLLVAVVVFLIFAGYSNWFLFSQFSAEIMLSCSILPYGGFLLGGLISLAARFDRKMVTTIAIETGINNVGVAVVLVQSSLPQPDADLAMVPIVAAQLMMPIPLLAIALIYNLHKRFCKQKKEIGEGQKDGERKSKSGHAERSCAEEGVSLFSKADDTVRSHS